MKSKTDLQANVPTRRQILTGAATGFAALTTAPMACGGVQQAITEAQRKAMLQARTSLHQEVELNAPPQHIYEVLLDSGKFAAFSGNAAKISGEEGGAVSMFGGRITGRNIELIPNKRIVQAWRPGSWPQGVYSVVKFELGLQGSKGVLTLDHTGFPEGDFESLYSGWNEKYWNPLKKYLSAEF